MFSRRGIRSVTGRVRRRRPTRPHLEALESRELLYSTLGAQWVNPQRITFSFVPDGTDLGGAPSDLYASMAADGLSTQQWQDAIRAAASVWQEVANINLVQVSDNGAPMGSGAYQQGDPGMGDIRIAGVALGGGYLGATLSPPPINGGSAAGDILLATDQVWKTNGTTFDLETVALHEIGHALGMDHSSIQQAVMYAYYTGGKQYLNADDVAGIDSIYQARQPDRFDTGSGNNWYTSATYLNATSGFSFNSSAQATVTNLDINNRYDQDWYYVSAPSNTTGTFRITMQSSGLSLLAPRIDVFNSSLQGLSSASSTSFGATVTSTTISNVQPGQGFFIRCVAGYTSYANDAGAYALQLNFGSGTMAPVPPPNTTVLAQPNQFGGGGYIGLSNGGSGAGSSSSFGYGFASRLVATLQQILGQVPGLGHTLSNSTGILVDQATGLLKIGNLTVHGDVLSVSPQFSTSSGRVQTGGLPTCVFGTPQNAPVIFAFPLDLQGTTTDQSPDRRRGH